MAEKVAGKAFDKNVAKRLLRYVRPYSRLFALALFITVLLAVISPLRPILFQYMLDNQVVAGDYAGLRLMVLLVAGLIIVEAVVMYSNTYLTAWLGQSIIRDVRNQVFTHILNLRLKYFDQTPIGRMQTRTISDVETLNDVFSSGLVRIMGELLQLIAILIAMFYVSWKLTVAVLITLPLLIIATIVFKNKVKVAFQNVRNAVSEMNSFLQEHLTGMPVIHIFNREKVEMEKFRHINRDLRRANVNSVLYYSIFYPVVEIVTAITLGVLVWYGAGKVISAELQFGELVAFIMFQTMFFRPIRMLADQFNVLQMGMVSAERIFNTLDTDEFIPNTGKLTELGSASEGINIEFRKVSFAYNEPEYVLKEIDLRVNAGEKVALVGATGSGKSTIINLLSRFYEVQQGNILVNGVDIKEYDLSFLRQLTGVVLQEVFLFSGSIYDNITLNNNQIPLETVMEAARRVGAHAFISNLPGGYDYHVQERGATLSLGQRQLIAFARVMTYNPRVLVLDEATANIDTESEEVIQHAIDTVLTGRTSIIIAHRLSTIQKADKIVVLKKGRIIESGSHQQLLEQGGAYFALHQMQFAS
ncbi:MAG: ABC transporter ATP-binding protein [Bacteroidia bacterium]